MLIIVLIAIFEHPSQHSDHFQQITYLIRFIHEMNTPPPPKKKITKQCLNKHSVKI